MDYSLHTLKNGIRLLHAPSTSTISHTCILINKGSRDEPEGKAGLAHFIEHLIFKRTKKRSTNQILNRLESVGADLNAYTTKEYTCIHASFLNPYLDRTLELFSDILFNSTFPEEEMDKEKSVILDEIASYEDQPEEAIQDDFEDVLFAGNPLGNNILGTIETVKNFTRNDVLTFLKENYHTDEIVIGIFGNYNFKRVISTGERHFGDVPQSTSINKRQKAAILSQSEVTRFRPINQSHCMLGLQTYDTHQIGRAHV